MSSKNFQNGLANPMLLKDKAARPAQVPSAQQCFLECQEESQNYSGDEETQLQNTKPPSC
jgi:hypothetical protein